MAARRRPSFLRRRRQLAAIPWFLAFQQQHGGAAAWILRSPLGGGLPPPSTHGFLPGRRHSSSSSTTARRYTDHPHPHDHHNATQYRHPQHNHKDRSNDDDHQQHRKRNKFEITAPHSPMGDQPAAIDKLVEQIERGDKHSLLMGATGTGKTHVVARTIARLGKPTLVVCHNKTLAAQLARELRSYLSRNHVRLFVSYYNHYVPESYNEATGTYTAKKSSINDELDALRHLATRALVQHRDVVVVASVSCIYGIGLPESYLSASLRWIAGETVCEGTGAIEAALRANAYTEAEGQDLERGEYSLDHHNTTTGATLNIWPPYERFPMRIDWEPADSATGDLALRVASVSEGTPRGLRPVPHTTIFPAKHHLVGSGDDDRFSEALNRIRNELADRVADLRSEGKLGEAERLSRRVSQDLQLLEETGTCPGVENYSRHIGLREAGEPPTTLLDYFRCAGGPQNPPDDWLLVVDESHVTLPQLQAMHAGDRARKERLVKHGYRLPSALDNRPLRPQEFWDRVSQSVFVSATPSQQELGLIEDIPDNDPIEMVIRPTHVCDPEIFVRPTKNQLEDLLGEIRKRAAQQDNHHERVLAVTLTKKDAEDLADFLSKRGVSSAYLHSGLNTRERSEALARLQSGSIDCLVGVNLLREGLDLPQVSLVAILRADSEGFLRSETALLQSIGRAARNANGSAILYADRITESMKKCMETTKHRRRIQLEYNAAHGTETRSTEGSSVLSIFDLLKDQIEAEQQPLPQLQPPSPSQQQQQQQQQQQHPSVGDAVPPAIVEAVSLGLPTPDENDRIVTDHLPSKPGVYYWKDANDEILYIGKAKRLRSRVKSYLAPSAKHGSRIRAMLRRARSVEFVLTPSDRDALLLESNLIKHHQPPYNVLMKDDEAYPYICATIGDALPQLSIVPRRHKSEKASLYKYFGPYPHYSEIHAILQAIEEKYDLRALSFQARYGEVRKADYQQRFEKVLSEVFGTPSTTMKGLAQSSLPAMRSQYEHASKLFESEYNQCRDVVVVGSSSSGDVATPQIHVVHVLQLRRGLIGNQFSYSFELESGLEAEEDFADAVQTVLEKKHYPSGGASAGGPFVFFPDDVLTQYALPHAKAVKDAIRMAGGRQGETRIHSAAKRGARKEADQRALECALGNAHQVAVERSLSAIPGVPKSSVDGKAALELAELLHLETIPKRIECYDISHTQGEVAVGSRVVFLNGRPVPHLYRQFHIRSVEGVDDYASLEEVLERRFRRVWNKDTSKAPKGGNGPYGATGSEHCQLVDASDPWALPDLVVIDGGKGQLTSALKGMAKAGIFPDFSVSGDEKAKRDLQAVASASGSKGKVDTTLDGIFPRATARGSQSKVEIPVIALAKHREEVFVVNRSNPLEHTGADSAGMLLLRALRDESHRFALALHRRRRSKGMWLDEKIS